MSTSRSRSHQLGVQHLLRQLGSSEHDENNYDAMVLDSWDPEDFVVPNSGAVPADDPWEADPEGPFPAEPQRAPVSIASPVSEATDEAQLERTRRYSDSVCRQPAPDTAGIEGLLTAATRIPRRRHLPIECEDWSDLEEAEADLARAEAERQRDDLLGLDVTGVPDADLVAPADPSADDWPSALYVSDEDAGLDPSSANEWDEQHTYLADDFDTDLDIYEYNPDARQELWQQEPADDDTQARKARAKAAKIVGLLEVSSRPEQEEAAEWLTELFSHLKHPATFRAIHNVALEGLTLETLRAMVALRQVWLHRPEWWLRRAAPGRDPVPLVRGDLAMTWKLARRICRARADYAPEDMIDDDWLYEWLSLKPDEEEVFSFASYIGARVEMMEAEMLDRGLQIEYAPWIYDNIDSEDSCGRRHAEIMRELGISPVNPFDKRPGSLMVSERKSKNSEKSRTKCDSLADQVE